MLRSVALGMSASLASHVMLLIRALVEEAPLLFACVVLVSILGMPILSSGRQYMLQKLKETVSSMWMLTTVDAHTPTAATCSSVS